MEGTVGQAAHMAFPGASQAVATGFSRIDPAWGTFLETRQEYFWASLTTLAAVALLLSGGYRRLERVTTVLVAAVTLFTVVSVAILQWTSFRISLPDLESGLHPGRADRRGGAGVLGVRDHRRRGVGAVRLPLLVHREGLRAQSPARGPRMRTGPAGPGAGPGSCSSTPGSAWSSSPSPRSPSTFSARRSSIPRGSTPKGPR